MGTIDVTTVPLPESAEPAPSWRHRVTRLVPAACLLGSFGITVLALVGLVRSAFTGYDISDEGFYLYAADPANKANIANGLWGEYIGLVYRATGYSLTGFRIAGVVLLTACAAWLGWQAGGFTGSLVGRPLAWVARAGLVVSTVAAAQLYYALMILTPSYNWLALCGLMLALAGLLAALSAPGATWPRIGHVALISAGCFLAFWGRNVAGIGVWLLAQALLLVFAKGDRRGRLLLVAAGVGTLVVLAAVHVAVLLDAATTVAALNRAKSFNFAHGFSKSVPVLLRGAISQLGAAPSATLRTAGWWPLAGLAPALARFARPGRRAALAALASCAAVLAVGVALISTHRFDGGHGSYRYMTPSVLALLVTAGLAWAVCAVLRHGAAVTAGGLPRRGALLAGVLAIALLAAQALYAFTSNNPLLGQSSGASVFGLLAVQVLLVAAAGRERTLAAVVSVALLIPVALAACVFTARRAPYRDAPLATATTYATINRQGARVRLAPAYAAYFAELVGPARAAGFVPGTPLIDLTPFHPGAAEALGAAAPNTLLFGYTPRTERWVLSQQDPRIWRKAWLLDTAPTVRAGINAVTSVIGRPFPAGYQLVAMATWPWYAQQEELWRPRDP